MILIASLVLSLAAAQLPAAPVLAQVRTEVVPRSTAKPGDEVKLVVKVAPREGIHVYAPPQKQFKPISLALDAAPGVKIAKPKFPAPSTQTFEGQSVNVYDRPFAITVPVVLPTAAERGASVRVSGTLVYQACDNLVCYRPVTVPLKWDIQIQ